MRGLAPAQDVGHPEGDCAMGQTTDQIENQIESKREDLKAAWIVFRRFSPRLTVTTVPTPTAAATV